MIGKMMSQNKGRTHPPFMLYALFAVAWLLPDFACAQSDNGVVSSQFENGLLAECDAGIGNSCARLIPLYAESLTISPSDALGLTSSGKEPRESRVLPSPLSVRLPKLATSVAQWERTMLKIFDLAQRGCNLKSADACFYLSVSYGGLDRGYQKGMTDKQLADLRQANNKKAQQLVRLSCDYGSIISCDHVASDYRYSSPPDLLNAAKLYVRACNGGVTKSCGALDDLFGFDQTDSDSKKNRFSLSEATEIKALIEQGCENASHLSCVNAALGYMIGTAPFPVDGDRAIRVLDAACLANNMIGCFLQGALLSGKLPPSLNKATFRQDLPKAKLLLERACTSDWREREESCEGMLISDTQHD